VGQDGTHLQVGPDLAAELVQDGALLRQHLVVRAAAVARAPRGVLQVLDRLEEVLLGQTHFGVRPYLIGNVERHAHEECGMKWRAHADEGNDDIAPCRCVPSA
jgi:hypothetical protein